MNLSYQDFILLCLFDKTNLVFDQFNHWQTYQWWTIQTRIRFNNSSFQQINFNDFYNHSNSSDKSTCTKISFENETLVQWITHSSLYHGKWYDNGIILTRISFNYSLFKHKQVFLLLFNDENQANNWIIQTKIRFDYSSCHSINFMKSFQDQNWSEKWNIFSEDFNSSIFLFFKRILFN